MKKLQGTQTEQNLMTAYLGESGARNKYDFYASKAKKDGYVQIGDLFAETAGNEKEHAKIWFKLLHDGIGSTPENLKNAAAGENDEWVNMYREFEQTAKAEGFDEIATLFAGVAKIEKEHEERFLKLLQNIEDGVVFEHSKEESWICTNCGHIHNGMAAPDLCPVCAHPRAYFEIRPTNF